MRFFPFGSTRSLLRNIATAAPRFLPPSSSSSILYAPALAPFEPINCSILEELAQATPPPLVTRLQRRSNHKKPIPQHPASTWLDVSRSRISKSIIPPRRGLRREPLSDATSITQRTHSCSHVAHPASVRTAEKCPPCHLKQYTQSLRLNVEEIMSNGGWTAWREYIEENGDSLACRNFKQVTFGHDESKGYIPLKKSGWRNKRVSLTKVADMLEQWVVTEKEWEKAHKGELSEEGKMHWANNSAEVALKAYEKELHTSGPLIDVQNAEARVHHKRACETEDELAIEWGDPPISTTKAREDYDGTGAANSRDPPKRKRRCTERISFHPEVCIRADADIDTLRKSSTFATRPHRTSAPTASILRTNTNPKNPTNDHPKPLLPKLKLPQSVQPLNEGPYRNQRSFRRRNTRRRAGTPGPWVAQAQREIVDTSFDARKRDKSLVWAERESYYQKLQEEGDEWDAQGRLEDALNSKIFPSVKVARMHMRGKLRLQTL